MDPDEFRASYERTSFRVRHDLVSHPLLAAEAFTALASEIPPGHLEYLAGHLGDLAPDHRTELGGEPTAMLQRIHDAGSGAVWVAFHRPEVVPKFQVLLDEMLDPIAELVPAMGARESYLFMSGPDWSTPCHRDPEHNFLLQIRGTKSVTVGEFVDDDTRHRELERSYSQSGVYSSFRPAHPKVVELGPGDGLYIPPDMLHLARNGPELSISYSVVWRPPGLVRTGRVYEFNGWLRSHGRTPTPPGRSVWLDRVKAGLVWARLGAKRVFGRRARG